ncbi:hypothetical protein [Vallitalea okinawensis]|uniref:hypothetical protein n=1 Tax=Vallitalea okinawensis TaxID=2078660 RepID=UPI000CFC8972|nr:hypothetical protein [Vallitalea okinawensis]
MIRENLCLTDILIGFENTLRIDYKDSNVEKTKIATKRRLENLYQIHLVGDIYDLQAGDRLVGDQLSILLEQLTECMKSLALLLSITMFDKRFGQTLKDINFLGFEKDNLLSALQFLQDEILYESRESFFDNLVRSISAIQLCSLKRLLVIMVVLENLGIKEGVALIAQYLYLGAEE